MIYINVRNEITNDNSSANSYILTEDTINAIAEDIKNNSFVNIQIPNENMQLDLFFSWRYYNQGVHKYSGQNYSLLVGIIGFGFYNFRCLSNNTTSDSYYREKLGLYSELLFKLLNKLRDIVNCRTSINEWKEDRK